MSGRKIDQDLVFIQSELKAKKDKWNKFGKFHYRSYEGIVESLKPLLKANTLYWKADDDVVEVGGRVYVKATVSLVDGVSGQSITATALAREAEQKKGMDESQRTGTASSYARKYAAQGLLALDDGHDADSEDNTEKKSAPKDEFWDKGENSPPHPADGDEAW